MESLHFERVLDAKAYPRSFKETIFQTITHTEYNFDFNKLINRHGKK